MTYTPINTIPLAPMVGARLYSEYATRVKTKLEASYGVVKR